MTMKMGKKIHDLPELRNRVHVFKDRPDAGKVLSRMLKHYRHTDALVLAVPAGGVAVASVLSKELDLRLDLAVVSKITLPWNTEAGYGAVAFNGTVLLNEAFLSRLHLSDEEIRKGIKQTEEKVARRLKLFRGDRPLPDLRGPILLVDDGLASGFTLRTAAKALREAECQRIIVAVPTAHLDAAEMILEEADEIYCPNVRSGLSFAVADAFEYWSDLDEEEVLGILADSTTR